MRVITKNQNIVYIIVGNSSHRPTQPWGRPITTKLDPFGLSVLTRNAMLHLFPSQSKYQCILFTLSEKGANGRRGRRLLPSGLEKNKSSLETSYCNGALGACQDIVWFNIYLRWTSDGLGARWEWNRLFKRCFCFGQLYKVAALVHFTFLFFYIKSSFVKIFLNTFIFFLLIIILWY